MKKFILFVLVLALTTALVLTAFQVSVGGGDGYAVGWNTRRAMFNSSAGSAQSMSFQIKPPSPSVGWNS